MSPRTPLLAAVAVLAVAAPIASAADPGRWRLAQADSVPTEYFQGLTHGAAGSVLFIGPFEGAYRTTTALKEQARVASIYPADVGAIGFNHAGDPTYDAAEGGRLLAPMECYHPDQPQANTCGIGGFGVIDPITLAWRYWVRLDQADLPKAMWAEVSPDGQLIWTSSGNDLLAYRTADIAPASAATAGVSSPPIHPVKRLPGVVPPSGITGAVFVGDRLFLAGEADATLQVWSVDLTGATPAREELELPGVSAESEGLDLLDMRGGLLHWLLSPVVDTPTYGTGHSELLTFLPKASARLRVRAVRRGHDIVATVTTTFAGRAHPVTGATIKLGARRATTTADGRARFRSAPKGKVRLTAAKLALLPGSVTVR